MTKMVSLCSRSKVAGCPSHHRKFSPHASTFASVITVSAVCLVTMAAKLDPADRVCAATEMQQPLAQLQPLLALALTLRSDRGLAAPVDEEKEEEPQALLAEDEARRPPTRSEWAELHDLQILVPEEGEEQTTGEHEYRLADYLHADAHIPDHSQETVSILCVSA